MTPTQLRNRLAAGESAAVAFLSDSPTEVSDEKLIETVASIANRYASETATGWVFVGVEPNGHVTGAQTRHRYGTVACQQLQATIANHTRPFLTTRVQQVPIDGKHVLAIRVPKSQPPISDKEGYFARRLLNRWGQPIRFPMQWHELIATDANLGLRDYSALPLHDVAFDDLDAREFSRFRRMAAENLPHEAAVLDELSDLELAISLDAVDRSSKKVTVRALGLLLFGRNDLLESCLPTHEFRIQVTDDGREVFNETARWPLLQALQEIESRLRPFNCEPNETGRARAVNLPRYFDRTLREGLVNAMTHRDYTQAGAIHVQWCDDHLTITSPGSFPIGVPLDNLRWGVHDSRSPLLAEAMRRVGVAYRAGQGIRAMDADRARKGYPAPSYERTTNQSVVLELRRDKLKCAEC